MAWAAKHKFFPDRDPANHLPEPGGAAGGLQLGQILHGIMIGRASASNTGSLSLAVGIRRTVSR